MITEKFYKNDYWFRKTENGIFRPFSREMLIKKINELQQQVKNLTMHNISGSLPSRELEQKVLDDYLDWCRNKYSGIETINAEMISDFVNGQCR